MTAALEAVPSLLEATVPPERRGLARDRVRLLVTRRSSRSNAHHRFDELPSILRAGDLLVVNDSATIPAAVRVRRNDGSTIAVHVSTKIDERLWTCEPRGIVGRGEELQLPGGASMVAIAPIDPHRPRLWYAAFELAQPMHEYLERFGEPIRYGYVTQRFDMRDYQTIFARERGSVEMPSAGRPFTRRVLRELHRRCVEIAPVTLHCGVASFEAPERPGTERFTVCAATAEAVNAARSEGRRVIAVGTTVVRALESAALPDGELNSVSGWTDLVLDERSTLRAVDGLLTGFHQATATHQWILRAFADGELLERAYGEAAGRAYLCHEFGDVQLIV